MDYSTEFNMIQNKENLYTDIQKRTGGEIYIGIVGPVRTGKSTFIKRFMDIMVLPYMEEEHAKMRAQDELPQSSGGRTITTTEPKFIPKESAQIKIGGDIEVKVRLIDCVGYMVQGASGHMEDDVERMVKTPWFDGEIPFTQAAEIGTRKVIVDHSTIGIVITTDGSFGDIYRENYVEAEERTIMELKKLHKPFIVIVNTTRPYGEEAKKIADEIEEHYQVRAIPLNCEQLKKEDINLVMEKLLYEFPLSVMEFYMPKWVEMLPSTNKMKLDIVTQVRTLLDSVDIIRDILQRDIAIESPYIKLFKIQDINMSTGVVKIVIDMDNHYYYEMLSEMLGETITSEFQLMKLLKEMAIMKKEYVKVQSAIESVRQKGYGVVTPYRDEIRLEKPEVIRHGNKFGVKIKAESPSIHMIRANIETEIAPIVGTEEQAKDLIRYIDEAGSEEEGIWDINIFGKTVEQLVNDGITGKISMIGEESQVKLQDTMQKIVNDTNGGLVCIII